MTNIPVFYLSGGGDEQYTPAHGVEILIPHIQHLKEKVIWLPFDTEESEFVRVLRKNNFNVVSSHISQGLDFFQYEPAHFDVILGNPPYKDKRRFIERCDSFNKPWALLLPLNIWSDSILHDIFGSGEEMTVLIPRRRMRFLNNEKKLNNSPTFKAVYFGKNFFKRQIIMTDWSGKRM